MEQVIATQADLQSALGLLRLNGWGQPQEDYLVRSLARLHGMLAVLGSPMYDAETHPEVRVAPVGGAEERECPRCHGTGGKVEPPDEFGNQYAHHDCRTCDGEGTVLVAAGVGGTGVRLTREEAKAGVYALSKTYGGNLISGPQHSLYNKLVKIERASVGGGAKDG